MNIILFFTLASSSYCFGSSSPFDVKTALERFHSQPKLFMEEIPFKWSEYSFGPKSKFTADAIHTKSFLNQKDTLRQKLCTESSGRKKCPTYNQNNFNHSNVPSDFIALEVIGESDGMSIQEFFEGSSPLKNMRDLDLYREREVSQTPWSDTYWPLYKGALGQRFADPNFPSGDWRMSFDYISQLNIFAEGSKEILSPSEKYDFLVGDKMKTLTESMWNQGRPHYESDGKVETWMGLCHGWAAASYMLARPSKSIEVTAFDGQTKVKMYPSDIKALATSLWASAHTNTFFVGGRCSDKSPPKDENGRIISSQCFDTNPGVWHLALVNRIRDNKPFVFDASYDYEVWNQPVLGYSIQYVNPETLDVSEDLNSSVISMSDFKKDKFKKYRSPKSKFIVGISMEVVYLAENQPSSREIDSPEFDSKLRVQYLYDLELDTNWNIIGGEWYYNAHPDFIWTPQSGARAISPGDYMITSKWMKGRPTPAEWVPAAQRSSKQALPLASVVERLVEWSQ